MNSKLRFFLTSLFILFVVTLYAAPGGDIRVSGVVMSEGEPLPGASVLVKGTHNGTVTDVDGKYTLTVPADATLVFSFIGYFYIKRRGEGKIAKAFIPTITEPKPEEGPAEVPATPTTEEE